MSLKINLTNHQKEKLENAFEAYSNNPGCIMKASVIRAYLTQYISNEPGMDVPVMTALRYLYKEHSEKIYWDLKIT